MPIINVERKLFTIGQSLAITLPKAWINYFDLKAGDSVEVITNDNVTIRIKRGERNIDYNLDLTEKE